MMVIKHRTISDNLQEQKIYIFTDNYLDNQRFKTVFITIFWGQTPLKGKR